MDYWASLKSEIKLNNNFKLSYIMNYRLTALLGVGLLSLGTLVQAQDFDDIYYDGSESPKPTEKVITTPVRTSQVS